MLESDAFERYERLAIAPVDDRGQHAGNPLAVPINPRKVVLLDHLAVVSRESLKPDPVGRVDDLGDVDRVLAIFLGI